MLKNVWLINAAVFVNFLAYASVPVVETEKTENEAARILLSFNRAPILIVEKRCFDDDKKTRHVKIPKIEPEEAKQKPLINETFGIIEKITTNTLPVRKFSWECCFKKIERPEKLRHKIHIQILSSERDDFQLDSHFRVETLARLKLTWKKCKDCCKRFCFKDYENLFAETFYIDIEAWKIDTDSAMRASEKVLKK